MWNVPNIMTLARLGGLPVIVLLVWPGIENRHTCFWAAFIFSVGAVFDIVDGYIARRYNLVTVFGKFLDPLADKLYYLIVLVALLQLPGPRVPSWLVMVVITRELTITGLRGMAVSEGVVIAAGTGGKMKQVFSMAGAALLLAHYPYIINFGVVVVPVDFHLLGLWLTYMAIAFSLVSAFGYIRGFIEAMKAKAGAGTP